MLDFNKKTANQPSSIVIEYLQALMSGNKTMLSEINGMKLADQQDSALVQLINKLWSNDSTNKKENFFSLLSQLNTNNKAVACIIISASALSQGNVDDAIEYITDAKMLLVGVKGLLVEIANLISLHAAIELGKARPNDLLKVSNLSTDVAKGYFSYLQAQVSKIPIGRSNSIISYEIKQKHLRTAISIFRRINNLYLLALAQIKLAQCQVEQSEVDVLLSSAGEIFENLGRKTELNLCQLLASRYKSDIETTIETTRVHRVGALVYASEKMGQIKEQILQASSCNYPVLITGPSGSGKELIAKAIHENSKRFNKPLIVVNCGAITETLMESELFGHVKGAFTGASRDTNGFIGSAETGTLFLDEIAELSRKAQSTLLRVTENCEYQRVGSSAIRQANVRIIAATNQNIDEQAALDKAKKVVKGNVFKHDLLNRFTIRIDVPPLSERREDVLVIAEEILKQEDASHLSFSQETKEYLAKRDYEHNVRELKNLVKKGIIAAKAKKEEIISIDMLEVINNKLQVGSGGRLFSVDCSTVNYQEGMATLEKGLLEQLVKMADSNIKRAIDLSGMAKTTLYRRMAIYGIKLLEN